MSYLGQQLGQGQAERFVYTASGGETSVTTSDDGRAIAYTVGQVDVYLNGAKLINGSDFTATTGTSITGLAALTASDVVEVFALSIFQASDTVSAASGGTFNGNVTVDANLSVTGTVDINGGNIDGTVIGAATPAAGSFTTGSFSGNVGIGTSSPAYSLTVQQAIDTYAFNIRDTIGNERILIGSRATAPIDNITPVQIANDNAGNLLLSSRTNSASGIKFYASSGTTASEAMRIDSSGNLLVGTTETDIGFTDSGAGVSATPAGYIQVARSSVNELLYLNKLDNDGDIVRFSKDGTEVGSIGSNGGTNLYLTSGNRGLRFNDNDFSPITSANAYSDNTTDLGRTAARFDDIYATNGTIQTSDANEKQDIRDLSEAEARVAQAAKALLKAFRWKDSVAEKGDEARIHFGIIAQDLQAAFEAEGLDAGRYAMFIHSTWTDEETGEERSRMGVRYSELLAFIIAAL